MWSDKNKNVAPIVHVKAEEVDEEVVEKVVPIVKSKSSPVKKEDDIDKDDTKVIAKDDGSAAVAELRKQRLSFLTNLSTKASSSTDKPFLFPELFNIIVYFKQDKTFKEQKVELFNGKYQFKAKSY
jgi:hypothetical protein